MFFQPGDPDNPAEGTSSSHGCSTLTQACGEDIRQLATGIEPGNCAQNLRRVKKTV